MRAYIMYDKAHLIPESAGSDSAYFDLHQSVILILFLSHPKN